jgi:phospholipid-binding lipoprotein MlaA
MRTRDVIGAAAIAATIGAGAAQAQPMGDSPITSTKDDVSVQVSDPFEGVNRRLYAVHNVIDGAVLEPLAVGYKTVLPSPVRTGVRNVLRNLSSPVTFVNDVLQVKPSRAGITAARFGVNTTLGVVGVFDVASQFGWERHTEDFGQTLGHWGVGEGPYLFIPIAGPTNVRDLVGRVVDIGFDPLTYATYDGDDAVNVSRVVLSGLDARAQIIEPLRELNAQSPDVYASIKRVYTANRRNDVQDGAINVEALPDFDDSAAPDAQGVESQALPTSPEPEGASSVPPTDPASPPH